MIASNDKSIEFCIDCNLMNLKRKQIEEYIHVIKQVFETYHSDDQKTPRVFTNGTTKII